MNKEFNPKEDPFDPTQEKGWGRWSKSHGGGMVQWWYPDMPPFHESLFVCPGEPNDDTLMGTEKRSWYIEAFIPHAIVVEILLRNGHVPEEEAT